MMLNIPYTPTVLQPWQSVSRNGPYHLSAFLADAAERSPDQTLTVDGMEFTCEDAWMRVLRIATWLQENGVGRGDKVITVLRHSPDLHLITLAVAHIGAVISVLSTQTRGEAFQSILEEVEPACLFLEKSSRHLKPFADNLLTVWLGEDLNGGGWEEADFNEVMNTRPAFGMRFPGSSADPAFLVFPDSTGAGKASPVLLSHDSVRLMMTAQSGAPEGILSLFGSSSRTSHEVTASVAALEA